MGEFELEHPLLLGAILDAVSVALSQLSEIEFAEMGRMADFMKWATAASPAFGGRYRLNDALEASRLALNDLSIESDPVSPLLLSLVEERDELRGNATELLRLLELKRTEDDP